MLARFSKNLKVGMALAISVWAVLDTFFQPFGYEFRVSERAAFQFKSANNASAPPLADPTISFLP